MSENTKTKNAIVIEREFNANIDLIWQMWTDPEHFKQWYGPQGFSVPVADFDLSVGGKRVVSMSSPDGSMTMWTGGEHLEVTPKTRLVYTEAMTDENGNELPPSPHNPGKTEVTVELEAIDGRTKMTMTHAGVPAGSPGESGWNQAFDKLADLL